jgi:hypothetical protein
MADISTIRNNKTQLVEFVVDGWPKPKPRFKLEGKLIFFPSQKLMSLDHCQQCCCLVKEDTFSREGAYPATTRYCMETWQSKTDMFIQVSTYGRYIHNPEFTSHSRDNEKLESMKVWKKSMPVLQRLYLRIGSQLTGIHYPWFQSIVIRSSDTDVEVLACFFFKPSWIQAFHCLWND